MEDPNDPGHYYTSVTDRWDRDLQYRENVDECSLEYFNKHGGREVAVAMDLVARRMQGRG